MKKIAVLGALTLLVLGFSAPRVNAQLACVTTEPFCDRIEVEGLLDSVLTGNYDYECNDTFSSPMVGRLGGGHATFSGPAWDPGTTYFSDLDLAAGTEDFWSWDGVLLTQFLSDAPFVITLGACPPLAIGETAGPPRFKAE